MDVDQMVDDIFDQEENKNTKNLKQISKYKSNEYLGDDDFDIAYRTPKDINPEDLLPTEWEERKIGTLNPAGHVFGEQIRGSYYKPTKRIQVVEDDYFKEHPYPSKNNVLLHENVHYNANRKRDRLIDIIDNTKLPIVDSEINASNTKNLKKTIFDEYLNETLPIIRPSEKEKFINEVKSKPEELFALYGARFPEDILNPRNKISKKLNRMWFD